MKLNSEFFKKLQELETDGAQLSKTASQTTQATIDLYPNHQPELEISGNVTFEQNVVLAATEDLKTLKEKKQAKEPECMIELAHPESVYVSNALGDGGLVENQLEQHQKILQIINKLPTGNLIHIHAAALTELVKMADELEGTNPAAVAAIDEAIAKIAGRSDRLSKVAFWPLAAAIIAGVGAAGYGIWEAIKGVQEDLKTDSLDLKNNIESWQDKDSLKLAKPMIDKIYSLVQQLVTVSDLLMQASAKVVATEGKDVQAQTMAGRYAARAEELIQSIDSTLDGVKIQYPQESWTSTDGKVEEVKGDLAALKSQIGAAANIVEKEKATAVDIDSEALAHQHPAGRAAPESAERIKAIQAYLTSIGFAPAAITGKADDDTKSQLVELENYINKSDFSGEKERLGLGLSNLPGNRLAGLLDSNLTADKLKALVELFKNPGAATATDIEEVELKQEY